MVTRRPDQSPYPHLVPELRRLRGDALDLWGDATIRRRALDDVLRAWQYGRDDLLPTAVARVDAAVHEGLAALGLPRGRVERIEIRHRDPRRSGLKAPDCLLVLSGNYFLKMFDAFQRPDSIFRTWIHESLHARQQYADDFLAEYETYEGFEEGMIEGLARAIVREKAGMETLDLSYDFYVRAYRTLAALLDLEAESLWRRLWQWRTGEVRGHFVATVAEALLLKTGQPLGPAGRARLLEAADDLFRTGRGDDNLPDWRIEPRWREALS